MNNTDLRIATWNANGILDKRIELEIFLNIQNIDVCLISETHLTRESFLRIKGYQVYHTYHPDNKARGGSAVIVKQSLAHHQEQHVQKPEIQLTLVCIKTMNQNLCLGAAYCPPRYNLKELDYINFLKLAGERFIIGGDYNAKHVDWRSRLANTKGKELSKAINALGCTYHSSGKPTYWPTDVNKIPELLDFFIVKKVSQIS